MKSRVLLVILILLCIGLSSEIEAQPNVSEKKPAQSTVSVANETHRVEILKAVKYSRIGVIVPKTTGHVFIDIYLKTDDPCFDEGKNQACFDTDLTTAEKAKTACGEIETPDGRKYQSTGAGYAGDESSKQYTCGFMAPPPRTVTLRLRGYPEIKVNVKTGSGPF